MAKTKVIDYYSCRIKDDDPLPPDNYNMRQVAKTYDNKYVLMIADGPHKGKTFIGGYIIGQSMRQTLH